MNTEIQTMLSASEGRYPTRAEQAVLREWASKLDARLEAIDVIRSAEENIIGQTLDEVLVTYPNVEKHYKNVRSSGTRDMSLVLRYCAQAMLRGDIKYLDDSILTWMSTILRGVGLAPQFIEDTYRALARVAARELPPQVAELLRPYIERCAQVLPGRPETP
ncbi:MAG TPA: hypothetical protein VGB85_27310 [Nannocystis sp.]|jgi:hypothetical protein